MRTTDMALHVMLTVRFSNYTFNSTLYDNHNTSNSFLYSDQLQGTVSTMSSR